MSRCPNFWLLAGFFSLVPAALIQGADSPRYSLTVPLAQPTKVISPDLMGVFFEDLNYAADGGLYAELIQNRSFEYQITEQKTWNNLTGWELTNRGGKGGVAIDDAFPVHPNNPHYAVVEVSQTGDVALANSGFDGIVVRAGEAYDLSFFARQLYVGGRWDAVKKAGELPVTARLESKDGKVLAEAAFAVSVADWRRFSATLTPTASDDDARLVLVARERGGFGLDEVSLFPRTTFHNRPNGLRPDLAQAIADLKPKFMRFPGGCLVHGHGLGTMYRWKDTLGPIEQRRQQANLWGYHQTVGLGYYEYFQFCEDIGAKPLPVVPAGVCCQNAGHTGGTGQQGIPLEQMPAYVQDVLDLIEWANGPVTSTWGAKRAAAGHPEPFHLQYLGVGNEDAITPVFRERFQMISDAVKQAHPEITVIGTVGPFPEGEDYDEGWKIARELKVSIVDEHYYQKPEWFWANLSRYDRYDQASSKVYVGEYAAHDAGRKSTLRSAIAEAAYLTSLERNADVVPMASYAPLLARRGHTQWVPDMIYFTKTEVFPTINYQVQRLFSVNSGDEYLGGTITGTVPGTQLAASVVRDSASGDVIVKVVNGGASVAPLHVSLVGSGKRADTATLTVLAAANADAVNDYDNPKTVLPVTSSLNVKPDFDYDAPANSLSVIRIKTAK